MDMLKNDLTQEIKHQKAVALFWIISILSVLIVLSMLWVFKQFKIEISSELSWILLGVYVVVVCVFLVIYRLMAKVSDKEIGKHAKEKQRKFEEENTLDQENIEFYKKVGERLELRVEDRNQKIHELDRFM